MCRLTFLAPDRKSMMRFVKESLERGLGMVLVPQADGSTEVRIWDRSPA